MDTRKRLAGNETCSKCGEKDPDHMLEDCLKEIRCQNCRQDYLADLVMSIKNVKEILECGAHKPNHRKKIAKII